MTDWIKQIKWSEDGLVPAIVQDVQSKEVLMLAYMNEDSLKLSVETGSTWFWSRSRSELWNKGATSGHTQRIESLSYDCDGDTLLVRVHQVGPACHTGSYSCFFNDIELANKAMEANSGVDSASTGAAAAEVGQGGDRFAILGSLESVIAERHAERPEGAYTTYLFDKGIDKILKKVGEEATEAIIAAKNQDNDELRSEASDLIFHLLVLLRERGLPLDDVMQELVQRHGKPASNNAMKREQSKA
ncbi:bifunctional phosphoribosyl-AMP cyclohydrolase/phosphoribosyl-ATP pyrophosphatase [Paenibacillus sp. BIHB 4019]|uniref:Histidine biosynthesis bifunctional protein HisIE n=1 Tax=Paenibacillus sp. BIHB 4019 TaxID=1870819 RepID=A0A1B2DF35_9BACL|nr:bifunctional phosphoribosyl-AMP cyclohydrolase/phosphoribosyl-ATP diphosphatase HisIE [Paenibacillus sp. BIHB 4019]ANY66334.1 bifunctional phosphoribosyl-AMP cyclohydrolase/phosphoribosyl-ATP pyrophosphatase [Paenibacillus sp. BIHB 4019]